MYGYGFWRTGLTSWSGSCSELTHQVLKSRDSTLKRLYLWCGRADDCGWSVRPVGLDAVVEFLGRHADGP